MKREPWPYQLPNGWTVEQAEQAWPRDQWFRPDKVKLARQARGWTIAEAAKRAGITADRLSAIERNMVAARDSDKEGICTAWGFRLKFFAQDDIIIDFRHMFVSKLA